VSFNWKLKICAQNGIKPIPLACLLNRMWKMSDLFITRSLVLLILSIQLEQRNMTAETSRGSLLTISQILLVICTQKQYLRVYKNRNCKLCMKRPFRFSIIVQKYHQIDSTVKFVEQNFHFPHSESEFV
jgi:hypothetical protein